MIKPPHPDAVARWIELDCQNLEFKRVRSLIEETLRRRIVKYSDEQVAESAELLTSSVIERLEVRSVEYRADGIVAAYELSLDGGDAYFKALETPETQLLTALRNMSPKGFECFCKAILQQLKGQAVVQGGAYDGGVDFYGYGLSPGGDTGPAPLASQVWIVGQSKRNSDRNDIGERQLREFVGGATKTIALLRQRHPERLGILTPVLLAFWTTSDFDRNAKAYARQMGIWYLGGIGLSQLAIRVKLSNADVEKCDCESGSTQEV